MQTSTMLGFGFTAIAAAAGIAWGSEIPLALAFAGTGLGWWLLMRHSVLGLQAKAALERAARAHSAAVVCEYFAECCGQSSSGRGEITQLQSLLQDAVHRLTTGFGSMHALAQQQQSLALELCGAGMAPPAARGGAAQTGGTLAERVKVLSGVTEELGRSVNQTVTSLQFQDISRQLLAHTSERLAALEEIGRSVEALLRAEGIVGAPALKSLIAESERALAKARERTSRSPIRQEAMCSGAVELFQQDCRYGGYDRSTNDE